VKRLLEIIKKCQRTKQKKVKAKLTHQIWSRVAKMPLSKIRSLFAE